MQKKQGLGSLEREVMEWLWEAGRAAMVREVMNGLEESERAYTTIMTTMDRLYRKGLLVREREGKAYVYRPLQDRTSYWHTQAHETMQELLRMDGDAALTAFVDAASAEDQANLERLEALIQEHPSRRGEG